VAQRPTVMVTLYGDCKYDDKAFLFMLGDLVRDNPHVNGRIVHTSNLPASTVKILANIKKQVGDRWQNVREDLWQDHARHMMECDLLVYAAKKDGYGFAVNQALHAGTPVVCWNVAPFSEMVEAGKNGLLVRCRDDEDEFGAVSAVPDYARMQAVIGNLINDHEKLKKLTRTTSEGLKWRDEEFARGLDNLLPD
jgi:glycosyltransferase involved in cell wall biosynthesis